LDGHAFSPPFRGKNGLTGEKPPPPEDTLLQMAIASHHKAAASRPAIPVLNDP
jgi:hypothetical protein